MRSCRMGESRTRQSRADADSHEHRKSGLGGISLRTGVLLV